MEGLSFRFRGGYRPWLFVATFDADSGLRRTLRRYDVLPSGTSNNSNIRGFSGSTGEAFAASTRMVGQNQVLVVGRLDDDARPVDVSLGLEYDPYDVPDIGWDGEAFAVHARRNTMGEVAVVRVAPDGQVVLPATRFGATPSPGGEALGYRMSTNSVSGMSYLFDASALARLLSGHDRSGQSVSWAASGPLDVLVPGQDIAAPTSLPGVGAVDRSRVVTESGGRVGPAIIALSDTHAWVARADGHSITTYEWEGAGATIERQLVDSSFLPNSANIWDTRDLYAFQWQGERWLSFSEPGLLRVVKVVEPCTYQAVAKPPP
jgi:hypothetical protein